MLNTNRMAVIYNDDYTVGRTSNLNKYQADTSDAQKLAWIRNMLTQKSTYEHGAKFMTIDESNKNSNSVKQNTPLVFNSLLQIFEFSPPSDNLWNVEIRLSNTEGSTGGGNNYNGKRNLLQLYKNILSVNKTWKDSNRENWEMGYDSSIKMDNYITQLCNTEIGIFLAQSIQFTPMSVNFDDNAFGDLQQHGSFYKNGKIVKSVKMDDSLKINFLVSNYDITDILIEPWIAAIAQHGLIERGDICLKAQIILTEYSSSYPKTANEQIYSGQMRARKQYIFNNCFPTARDEIKKEYTQQDAGVYKNQVVSFKYDSYKIKYLF